MEKYKEIVEVLKAELAQGKYPVDSRFPSEYELANRFGVAHPTANKAVGELVSAGFLVRGKRGSGTRVCLTEKFPKGRILYVGRLDHLTPCRELKGFSTRAFQRGYYVTAANPPYMELRGFLSKAVATGEFAGIVSYAYHNFNELCPSLPIVYLDNDKFDASLDGHPELNYVTSANQAGSYDMVKYLEGKGYRNIVIYRTVPCPRLPEGAAGDGACRRGGAAFRGRGTGVHQG